MRYFLLLFLLCSCSQTTMTTKSLIVKAEENCRKEPEVDMQKMFCQMGYIINACKVNQYDLRICGELEKQ